MVAQLACTDCSRFFPTNIGLSQHRRHTHPTQHNADKLTRVKHSGARWSQQESQSLLRLANNLYPCCETQTALFARLEQYFPGRSAISIKTRLRVLNWQAQQDESSSGGPDQTIGQIAAYSSEADDYSVWFKQTVDRAVSLLESHADSSLASVDLLAFARGLQSGIMTPEQVLSLLDLHASRTFPHTWKTVSRRRRQLAHRMPVNRKQIRRANYAAIQTLYHQRRKDAASAVLDGSWKDLYKGNCGLPPDAEQYWKQVLSAPKHVDSRPSRVIVPSDWSLIEPITGEEVGRTVRSMGNSSPGLDKLTPRMLRRFNANPDLIAVRERRATVIDVSIVSDGRGMIVWNEKKQKYGADEFSLAIISALSAIGCDVDFLVHQPMSISYRGICFPQSAKAVIRQGLSKVTVRDLCLLTIVGSLRPVRSAVTNIWYTPRSMAEFVNHQTTDLVVFYDAIDRLVPSDQSVVLRISEHLIDGSTNIENARVWKLVLSLKLHIKNKPYIPRNELQPTGMKIDKVKLHESEAQRNSGLMHRDFDEPFSMDLFGVSYEMETISRWC
ncbi:endonuclease-reverse transcriptase [Clonorchis sinensis]|uniref:Endonuclease-reverse transcriptase n=1 Tax=Clonorchis sinensis TaxID=79923 RepID=G7Y3U6_CLOSI|nr:endonuclease-reverse transcriptase [Clonorchis sinensis]